MNITKDRIIEIIKEEVINESGGVSNFGGVASNLGAQRADGNDISDHDLYGPQQTAEDSFVGLMIDIGQMLDIWEEKEYHSDEARYISYFQDLQGLLEQYDPCAHQGKKCDEVHPNQSHEECIEVTINNALYEATNRKLNEMKPLALRMADRRRAAKKNRIAGHLNIEDVEAVLPDLSPGDQADILAKHKELNNQDDLRQALGMNENKE